MTGEELKAIRQEMGFGLGDMSIAFSMPYRTYQDYEYGDRKIPEAFAVKVTEYHRRDRELQSRTMKKVIADIERRYPFGIPAEANT